MVFLCNVSERGCIKCTACLLTVSFQPLSQGPFVHVASLCAALLSKFMAAVFGGIFMVRTDLLIHTLLLIRRFSRLCCFDLFLCKVNGTTQTVFAEVSAQYRNMSVLHNDSYLNAVKLSKHESIDNNNRRLSPKGNSSVLGNPYVTK